MNRKDIEKLASLIEKKRIINVQISRTKRDSEIFQMMESLEDALDDANSTLSDIGEKLTYTEKKKLWKETDKVKEEK